MVERARISESTLVHRAALLLAVSAFTSALTALLRDRLLASTFGASRELDMYFAAFRLPDLLYACGLFLVASTAVLPLLASRRAVDAESEKSLVGELLTAVALLFCVGGVIAFVALPYVVPIMFPGFSGGEMALVTSLSRILLLSPILLGVSALLSSVVQSRGFFASSALAPVLYNFGIIFGLLVFAPTYGLWGVVWGVLVGAFLHLAVQIPSFWGSGFTFTISKVYARDVIAVVKKSYPRSAAVAVQGGVTVVMMALASLLGAGAIAVYQLAFNLSTVPLSIIGLSYGTAVFPLLSRLVAEKNEEEFLRLTGQVARQVMLWSMISTALLIVFRAHIVRMVLGAGAFGWVDTMLAAASLACFAFGLIAQAQMQVFTRACYALNDVKGPFIASVLGGIISVGSAYTLQYAVTNSTSVITLLEAIFRLEDVRMARVLALPLGYSCGVVFAALFMMLRLRRRMRSVGSMKLTRSTLEHFAGSVSLVAVSVFMLRLTAPFFPLETLLQVILHAGISATVGIAAALGILVWLENEEVLDMQRALRSRWGGRIVTSPEAEHL